MARAELQLAWEFSTGSLEYATNWIVRMRDDATARLPNGSPTYRVTSVQDDVSVEYASAKVKMLLSQIPKKSDASDVVCSACPHFHCAASSAPSRAR